MKRRLEKEELKIATKVLVQRKEELEWLEYQLNYYKLMLEKGLEVNYRKTIRDFKEKKKEFKEQFDICRETISILTSQIRDGVEIKEDKKEDKK